MSYILYFVYRIGYRSITLFPFLSIGSLIFFYLDLKVVTAGLMGNITSNGVCLFKFKDRAAVLLAESENQGNCSFPRLRRQFSFPKDCNGSGHYDSVLPPLLVVAQCGSTGFDDDECDPLETGTAIAKPASGKVARKVQ